MSSVFGVLLKKFWMHPLAENIQVDEEHRITAHRKMIESKPVLKHHLWKWYQELLPAYRETMTLPGKILEIGSGAGFIEEVIPGVVKSDVIANPFAQEIQDATRLSYRDNSLRAIFVIGVLHHIEKPDLFFRESVRCLAPGGRLVIVEPNNTFPQKILCKILSHYEYFDENAPTWDQDGSSVMSNANLALPWIIFFRDRSIFEKNYPSLKIINVRYHSLFFHLLSGGMTYRSFIPRFLLPVFSAIEFVLHPLMKFIGTSMTIDIRKN